MQFQNILVNVAAAFLSFADHFKLYSSFCASHSKAQKLLHPVEGNQALQSFLAARNFKQQHSNTLESYLIKPIQRILKYPLLLQQLRNLCDTNSEEYRSLVGKHIQLGSILPLLIPPAIILCESLGCNIISQEFSRIKVCTWHLCRYLPEFFNSTILPVFFWRK